jgi:hypothetical protein
MFLASPAPCQIYGIWAFTMLAGPEREKIFAVGFFKASFVQHRLLTRAVL